MQGNLLKAEMAVNEITAVQLADKIGMNVKTLYNKINGTGQFTVDEAIEICKVLHIDSPERKARIFLE